MAKVKIISAKGADSFTDDQVSRIRLSGDVSFKENLTEMTPELFIETVQNAEIIAVTRRTIKNISSSILASLPALRAIAIYSTGYEWIDMQYANSKGIIVNYLPDYSSQTVAEHTVGMVLCLCRRLHLSFDKVRNLVPQNTSLRGIELAGKSVGIIGFGKIGKTYARLIHPFGVNILYYDIKPQQSTFCAAASLDELLSKSDIIVLLPPQIRDNEPLIGKQQIQKMKKGVYIVNPSRSSLVDNEAVVESINNNDTIAGYAVDDTVEEMLNSNIVPGKILQTGHTAWYSDEAICRGTEQWVQNIISLIKNKPINVIKD